jgi:hypothetical protein
MLHLDGARFSYVRSIQYNKMLKYNIIYTAGFLSSILAISNSEGTIMLVRMLNRGDEVGERRKQEEKDKNNEEGENWERRGDEVETGRRNVKE